MFGRLLKMDARLAADLRKQRSTIIKGLVCAGIASALASATIPLTRYAIDAIGAAAPVRTSITTELPNDQAIAQAFNVPVETARERLSTIQPQAQSESKAAQAKRQDDAIRQLGQICLLVVGVFLLKYFFTRGQTYYLSRASIQMASDLRTRLFKKLQRLPMKYFNGQRTGNIQSVLNNDVSVYQNAVQMVRDGIDGPFKAIIAIVQIVIMEWRLAAVALLFIPILAWLVDRNGRKMKRAQAQVQTDLGDLAAITSETLNGTRVIKAFGAEAKVESLFQRVLRQAEGSQLHAAYRFATLRPMVEFMGACSLAAVLFICGWLAKEGTLQIGEIVAITLGLDLINQGSRAIANMNNTYNQVTAANDRIHSEVLDIEEEPLTSGARTLENPIGRIEFRDVHFAYPDGTKALNGVSFTIEPNTSLALVGPSGAGKSTIADLILRFDDPTSGHILFDGVDLRDLDLTWLRQQFGVVPQATFLFAGSIEENLLLAPNAEAKRIPEAAHTAHVDAFVERFDEKYQTQLGERGTRLSGGEMQRLAIARALVANPKVLVMDEATSNLDPVSEKHVTEALVDVMQARTTLFIAHRLSTAARANRIAVVRKGEIVEIGSHDQLVQAGGTYATMYAAFSAGALSDAGY